MPLKFVNIHGQEVNTQAEKIKQPPKEVKQPPKEVKPYHKGWRVMGIPPSDEAAKATPEELNAMKLKPVRSKPYVLPQAAQEAATLAYRYGWRRVSVVGVKKD